MQAELAETEQELRRLRQQASKVQRDLAEYYERLMGEFWRNYPPLSICEEVRLHQGTIEAWMEERRDGLRKGS